MLILQTLGVAACLGGPVPACAEGVKLLRDEWRDYESIPGLLQLHWQMLHPDTHHESRQIQLYKLNSSISRFTEYWVDQEKPFLVIGGDHSCALGTWAGVLNAMKPEKNFGLIWLDAHMDAHTFETTPSGNIHGMPLSALLGKADTKLQHLLPTIKAIKAENLILIGTRSYESEEYELLKKSGVTIVFANQIDDFETLLRQAVDKLSSSCDYIGLSVDLDFISPEDAPGVETPVAGGVAAQSLLQGLKAIKQHAKICGLEITEFNPENDVNHQTLRLIENIVETFYG